MTYRIGTSYFVDEAAAVRYYADVHMTRADVRRKLVEGEIHLGEPSLKAGERLRLIDRGTRYAIEVQG
jgi:hypothetical protein